MKSGLVRKLLMGAALALPILGGATVAAQAEDTYIFVSHAPDSDSWWNVIKNALKDAGKDFGVKVEYRNPSTGDLADMARIIQQATAQKPAGIISTIADIGVLKRPLQDAIAKGIPVITVNSGTAAESKEIGALMHIGQPEYDAGKGAGERAKAAGVTKFLCINHYITNNASVERCQGYADGLGVKLGDNMIDSGMDPTDVYNRVKAYLTAHPDTDGILTLGPNSADPVIKLLRDTNSGSKYKSFITFDLGGGWAVTPHIGRLFTTDDELEIDPASWEKAQKLDAAPALVDAVIGFVETCEWSDAIDIRPVIEDLDLKAGKVMHVIYTAIEGRSAGLPLFPSIGLLGRESALQRLRAFRARF